MGRFALMAVLASLGCNDVPDARPEGKTPSDVTTAAVLDVVQLAPRPLPVLGPSLFGLELEFEDQAGRRLSTATLRHRGPLIVSMFYASCSYACPTLIRDLANVDRALDPAVRAQTRVLLVTFDPGHDTPELLSRLAQAHGAPTDRWTFARAKDDAATRELAAALGITYRRLPDGNYNHSSVLLLLDADGVPRAEVQGLGQDTQAFVAAIGTLARTTTAASDEPAHGISPARPTASRFEVHVAKPTGSPRVATDRVDALGRPVTVGCATCHSLGLGDGTRTMGATLTQFHQALVTRHGTLACRSCHEAPDYANLHLADGTTLPFTEVQTLCRQCHGPQGRDFDRGSHGGMNGYWDLTRGPRERHACTTCHDPHAPAYVGMIPARGPVPQHFGGE